MDIRANINKITCTYKDPNLESDFKNAEWNRGKSKFHYTMIALIILAVFAFFIEFNTKSRWESTGLVYPSHIEMITNWMMISHVINIFLYVFTLFSSERIKIKYGD